MGGESIVVRRGEHGWQVGEEQAAGPPGRRVIARPAIHSLWITMG
jgi:hypothetical protein